MTSAKKHIDFLDQIRGLAILAVFLYHCLGTSFGQEQLPWGSWIRDFSAPKAFLLLLPLTYGWVGVAIFFVVSGFSIHLSFSRNPNWRDFGIRRVFRIYPPYLLALLLFMVLLPWTRPAYEASGIAQLGTHLALIHNYDDRFFFGINPSFWSIAVEAQLYLLYPVLLALVAWLGWRRSLGYIAALELGLRTLASVLLIARGDPLTHTVTNVILVAPGDPLHLPLGGLPLLYWYSWSIGAAVAEAYRLGRPLPFANHSLLAWGVVAIGSVFLKPLASFSFVFFALLTATAIAKLLQREQVSLRLPKVFSTSLRTIGLWSYSIYLLHQPLLTLAPQIVAKLSASGQPQALVSFALCLCLWLPIVGLSALWYRAFELPSIALSKKMITGVEPTYGQKSAR